VVAGILPEWLEPSDTVESLDALESEQVADRERVGYRFTVTNPGEPRGPTLAWLGLKASKPSRRAAPALALSPACATAEGDSEDD
jgi:hypothetical protein